MKTVLRAFEERVADIEAYLALVESIDNGKLRLPFRDARRDHCLKVMKASAFLLFYNVVESTITSSFQFIYDEVRDSAAPYDLVSDSIRNVWWTQRFSRISAESANRQTYATAARQMGDEIYDASPISLSARDLPISGSLDADKIRVLCQKHGIKLRLHHRAFGGAELRTVKDKRNDLAHGTISFSECGRDYTVADLRRISRQVVTFLRSVIASIERFDASHGYLN